VCFNCLSFETAPDGAVTFEALSSMYGFPEVPGVLPRPDAMVPEPNTMRNGIHLRGEHMYVRNRVVLPPADGQTQDETPEITPMS